MRREGKAEHPGEGAALGAGSRRALPAGRGRRRTERCGRLRAARRPARSAGPPRRGFEPAPGQRGWVGAGRGGPPC